MSASNKFKITTHIRQLLLANPKIIEKIGENIFPLVASKDTKGDIITYQRDAYNKSRDKMGVHSQECFVWINAISDTYDRSQELACLIDETLDGSFTFNGQPIEIWLDDSTEEFEDGKFIQVLLYKIK